MEHSKAGGLHSAPFILPFTGKESLYEKAARKNVEKARDAYPYILSGADLDDKDVAEMEAFAVYHSNRERFLGLALDEYGQKAESATDMWAMRGRSAVLILEEVFQHDASGVRTVRDAIGFLSMDKATYDVSPLRESAMWSPVLENLDRAESGEFGEVVSIMTKSFLDGTPDYRESRRRFRFDLSDGQKACSEKASEQIGFCIMPFNNLLMKKLVVESRATEKRRVKDLANRLSKVMNGSLSEVYEFISRCAGEPSWNHLSAKLKG